MLKPHANDFFSDISAIIIITDNSLAQQRATVAQPGARRPRVLIGRHPCWRRRRRGALQVAFTANVHIPVGNPHSTTRPARARSHTHAHTTRDTPAHAPLQAKATSSGSGGTEQNKLRERYQSPRERKLLVKLFLISKKNNNNSI